MKTIKAIHPHHQIGQDHYLELVRLFALKPIRTERQFDQAMAVVRKLALRGEKNLAAGERDYLEALTILIEDFDRRQSPPPRLRGIDYLRHLLEANGMGVTALGRIIGSQPLASLVLAEKRALSRAAIFKLAEHFGVEAGLFL